MRVVRFLFLCPCILASSQLSMTGSVDGSTSGTRYEHGSLILVFLMGNQAIGPMASILVGMMCGDEVLPSLPIQTRWKGKNTAVHASLVYRNDIEAMGPATKDTPVHFRWRLTHLATGFSAAKFMCLTDALKVAKLFDSLFNYTTEEEIKENKEFVQMFTEEVKNNGGILCGVR
jgi:hypothetical protein